MPLYKTVSIIDTTSSAILFVLLALEIYNTEAKSLGTSILIMMFICIFILILATLIKFFKKQKEEEPNYLHIKNFAITDIFFNSLELIFFLVISKSMVFYYGIESLDMDLDEAIYLSYIYSIFKKYVLIISIISLICNIISYTYATLQINNYSTQNEYSFFECPNCGTSMPKNMKFCGNCGAEIKKSIPKMEPLDDSKAPYKCARCGALGPYDGSCPICSSTLKDYNY